MANVSSSMSKNSGLVDALLSDATKSAPNPDPKSKKGTNFEDHLGTHNNLSNLAATQKQTREPARPTSKRAEIRPSGSSSVVMNPSKTPVENTAKSTKTIERPQTRAATADSRDRSHKPSQTKLDDNTDTAQPNKSAKTIKPNLKGMSNPPSDSALAPTASTAGTVLVIQPEDIPAEDQATLDAIAFDPKSSVDEPWQKRLEDMLSFMGIPPEALQQNLPVLAILTGQLQNVEPDSIPSLLAESPLLNSVMASANPETVIEQVKPLGMWLDEMGWSPEGLVIKDPEAFQELMNTPVSLKDVMKTFDVDVDRVVSEAKILQETLPMDGATPYIQRAERMRPESRNTGATIKKGDGKQKSDGNPELLAALNSNALPKTTEPALKTSESSGRTQSIDQLPIYMNTTGSPNAEDKLSKVVSTHINPFESMNLRSGETFTFDTEVAKDSSAALTAKSDSRDWLENIQASQIQADTPQSLAIDKSRGFNPEALLDLMNESALRGLSNDQGKDGRGEDFLASKEESQPPPSTLGSTKSQNTFELGIKETESLQPTHPINKAVFEKAEMLVKEGGGAIRIDIGNKDTGTIDLAVEVKDGKVEVKISAQSPEARQLIAQELPKLKESLQNQNLSLSRVEVGLSGGSSWTSSDGRSSRKESSSNHSSEELLGVKGNRKSSSSYSRESRSQEIQPSVTREGGGIKVRV